MTKQDYRILLDELEIIAEKVGLFPESLHESVFNKLVEALIADTRDETPMLEQEESEDPITAGDIAEAEDRSEQTLVELYDNARFNDMEFSALAALFFADLTAPDKRTESIGPSQLVEACRIVGRKIPSNPATTLNNALHVKGYLANTGRWGNPLYQLTPEGRSLLASKLTNRRNADLQLGALLDNVED